MGEAYRRQASPNRRRFAVRITGNITHGEGSASTNYERMIAAAAVYCAAVADCGHFGTINVRLDQPIDKGHADCWTPKTLWKPKVMGGKPSDENRNEEFGFVNIKVEYPLAGDLHDAWIIFPSGHTATYCDPHYVEIIASKLIGGHRLESGSCGIHLVHAPSIARPASFGDNWVSANYPGRLW
jgi:hypothetical protein